jgi:hypothetical protein
VWFLKADGAAVSVAAMAAVETMVALATGEISEGGFAAWLGCATNKKC